MWIRVGMKGGSVWAFYENSWFRTVWVIISKAKKLLAFQWVSCEYNVAD